jgi:glycosyltransferase involved in cell wall biosynthesis
MPKISVLLPVHNGECYIAEAVESILHQTYRDFELIVIDDGSVDLTAKIIRSFRDKRILHIKHERKLGIVASLNEGLELAKGEYIARMDADDISLPRRFELQLDYLREDPTVGVLGCRVIEINSSGNVLREIHSPLLDSQIRWLMCFENPMRHPTVLTYSQLLRDLGGYRNFRASEDYDLWQRMSEKTRLANLGNFLLLYRLHGSNASQAPNRLKVSERRMIREKAISSILGAEIPVPWDQYWNDNYSASLLIYQLYKKISEGLSLQEKYSIRTDAAKRIFSKARAIEKGSITRKMSAFLLSIYLQPKLIYDLAHSYVRI